MSTPAEKLASSLELLHSLQKERLVAIRSTSISRTHRERLISTGYLREVMKGWYIATSPDERPGDSTSWYTAYWPFCAQYLEARFSTQWSLSPEQSLRLHSGIWTIPLQLPVRAANARNKTTAFPFETSLLEIRTSLPEGEDAVLIDGIRLFSAESALILVSKSFFQNFPTEAQTVLALLPDTSFLLNRLLSGGHTRPAGRLAGAFRHIGMDRFADEIIAAMRSARYDVRESNPFTLSTTAVHSEILPSRSAYRLRVLWGKMRMDLAGRFPRQERIVPEEDKYLKDVDELYAADAYHSLSIEGYEVNAELIERVRSGGWNPDTNESDRQQRNALAARGYWQAYQSVKQSIRKVLAGENPGKVADQYHGAWYRELFAPSVNAGIIEPAHLAGYRSEQVFIRNSMHVPFNPKSIREAVPTFFELVSEEDDEFARIVLGHFMFVYIHPYMDGNGRMGRFLMNVMMAAAGLPWVIIPIEQRTPYMEALEEASVNENIVPFAKFLHSLM